MAKKYNIQEIVQGCCKQQAKYQRAFVDQYSDLLYAICIRYMKDRSIAKDLLQECLMRILKNIAKFDTDLGSFEAWISTITIRQCLKKIDKKKIHVIPLEHSHSSDYSFNPSVLDKINTQVLIDIINTLPDGYREVFNMAVIDGFSHEEIGRQMGIKEASSRSRLSRAKAMLREKITELQNQESWVNTA